MVEQISKDNISLENKEKINPYSVDGITLKITKNNVDEPVYNDIIHDLSEEKKIFKDIYFHKGDFFFLPVVYISDEKTITIKNEDYKKKLGSCAYGFTVGPDTLIKRKI